MLTKPLIKQYLYAELLLYLGLVPNQEVLAQAATPPAMLGQAAPFQLADLPSKNQLRQRLEALPSAPKLTAMAWLHSFTFPAHDLTSLRINDKGAVYYVDTIKPERSPALTANALPQTQAQIQLTAGIDVFRLHSRPLATNKVFLDFDGQQITGTAWNGSVPSYRAVPYDLDNNSTNFNTEERNNIAEIWHRIAEDYAPFNIDVTTENPVNFGPTVGHILFTQDIDANGKEMPEFNRGGGVAYVNVWGTSDYASTYSPALVYYNALGFGYPPYLAEAGTHEFGHNLGLSHDGVVDSSQNPNCRQSREYFCGIGSGNTSWAAIMGSSYYSNVTQWSRGEYPGANNHQDDIAIIAAKLQRAPDENKYSLTEAEQLIVEPSGTVVSTNPQTDPGNTRKFNKGIIETDLDKDMFWFDAGAGPVNIKVTPAWDAYFRFDLRGANLDIKASLLDRNGVLIANSELANDTYAQISTNVVAGRYYLAVTGVSNSSDPFPDYASLGKYFISGQILPTAIRDISPPNPNPMTWVTPPYAVDRNTVAMKATTARDNSGQVFYKFRCLSGGQGCVDSAWQASTSFVSRGLADGTNYSFSVLAKDSVGNQTTASAVGRTSTLRNLAPVLSNDTYQIEVLTVAMVPNTNKIRVQLASQLLLNVLYNDNDPDGDNLAITATGLAKYGSLTYSNSAITYKPKDNGSLIFDNNDAFRDFYNGESISYTVTDGHGGVTSAVITITPHFSLD